VCHDGSPPNPPSDYCWSGDTAIGTCPKSNGFFNCTLNVTLQPGQTIYATDGCFDPIRVGPDIVIPRPPAVPLLSPVMIVVLSGTLCLVGLLGLSRMRRVN